MILTGYSLENKPQHDMQYMNKHKTEKQSMQDQRERKRDRDRRKKCGEREL